MIRPGTRAWPGAGGAPHGPFSLRPGEGCNRPRTGSTSSVTLTRPWRVWGRSGYTGLRCGQ
eukprot:9588540-Alexandrium_andersonii.AAC.1